MFITMVWLVEKLTHMYELAIHYAENEVKRFLTQNDTEISSGRHHNSHLSLGSWKWNSQRKIFTILSPMATSNCSSVSVVTRKDADWRDLQKEFDIVAILSLNFQEEENWSALFLLHLHNLLSRCCKYLQQCCKYLRKYSPCIINAKGKVVASRGFGADLCLFGHWACGG